MRGRTTHVIVARVCVEWERGEGRGREMETRRLRNAFTRKTGGFLSFQGEGERRRAMRANWASTSGPERGCSAREKENKLAEAMGRLCRTNQAVQRGTSAVVFSRSPNERKRTDGKRG